MYKYVFTFLGGALVGAGGALVWLRKAYNKKVEEAVAEQLRKNEPKDENEKKTNKDDKNEQKKESSKDASESHYNALRQRLGYTGDTAEVMTRKADTSDSRASQGHSERGKVEFEEPYGISGQDYLLTGKENSKISLTYYKIDGVIAEEDGTPVEDVHRVLGDNWKDEIGKYDDDTAYIRNERMGSDFEIICEDLEYASEYGDGVPD